MKRELSPEVVVARLARLREITTLEDVETTRARLDADRRARSVPFAEAVARRLAELRALCELTDYLHRKSK